MNTPQDWPKILAAGAKAQRMVPGCVAVGGTAAAIHAHHRVSYDTDHVLGDLRNRFDDVLAVLESSPPWRTAKVSKPVLILGSVDGIQVGFRQQIRGTPLQTTLIETSAGPLVVPTLDEMICIKAFLAYRRNATRDFLDFAALASVAGDGDALDSLLKLDERYGELQERSIALSVAQVLSDPAPFDLEASSLGNYKGLVKDWQDWGRIKSVCQQIGHKLGDALVRRKGSP